MAYKIIFTKKYLLVEEMNGWKYFISDVILINGYVFLRFVSSF